MVRSLLSHMTDKTVHDGREMWRYGDAGDEYEVSEGDVWTVGEHRICCGDLYDGAWAYMNEEYGPPDMLYTDPPHGPSHEKSYRTKAGLDTDTADFARLMHTVVEPLDPDITTNMFFEAGNTDAFLMAEILEEALDMQVTEIWNITYDNDRPCKLLYFGPYDFGGRFVDMDDSETPYETMKAVMEREEVETVADSFHGNSGWTMRDAHRHGLRYFGTELHPRRMACSLAERGEQLDEEPAFDYNWGDR